MQKRGVLLLTLLASINFVSAIGIGDFLDQIGGENILLGGTFLIAFALLNMILGRLSLFKDAYGQTKKTSVIISLIVSLFIIYGIRTLNFDLENFFFNLGLSGDILYQIASIIVLIGLIYVIYKFGKKIWSYLCLILILSGIAFIWIGLSDLVFNGEPLVIAGLVLFILGIICWWRRRKKAPTFDKVAPEFMQGLVTNGDRQKYKNLEEQYIQAMEKLKQNEAARNPEVAKAAQSAQKALQEAQAEAARSAEAQRIAEAARKKAQEDIKLANEENEFLKKEYQKLANINNPEERATKEKELIIARDKAMQDTQRARQEAATSQKAQEAAAAEAQKAKQAQEKAQKAINETINKAHEQALKDEERRKKAEARKNAPKPDYLKLTIPKKAAANTKIKARVTWRGGLPPFKVQWAINNEPLSNLRDITKNQTSTTKIPIPNNKGSNIFVSALIRDENGNFSVVQENIEII